MLKARSNSNTFATAGADFKEIWFMSKRSQILLLLVLVLFVGNCAKRTMVVLVPDPDGKVGCITVSNLAGSVTVDTANQATIIKDQKTLPSAPKELEKQTISSVFSEVITIQLLPPVHFILYFQRNATTLTPASVKLIAEILSEIRERNSTDISVIGHSDTLGDKDYNFKLSKSRAIAISNLIVKQGVDQHFIRTTSHGEENPLIKTKDNVSEPKNRRVEVVVR